MLLLKQKDNCFESKMLTMIEKLCQHLSQQEIQAGFRKKSRSASANEAFVKAVTWLVTDAIAAK